MGGSLSCFGSGGYEGGGEEAAGYEQLRRTSRKVRPSDEDRLWYVGDRDVDRKAAEFIARFHASTRFVEP